jgi:hypothetical protein
MRDEALDLIVSDFKRYYPQPVAATLPRNSHSLGRWGQLLSCVGACHVLTTRSLVAGPVIDRWFHLVPYATRPTGIACPSISVAQSRGASTQRRSKARSASGIPDQRFYLPKERASRKALLPLGRERWESGKVSKYLGFLNF